jgi:hypothetical protein
MVLDLLKGGAAQDIREGIGVVHDLIHFLDAPKNRVDPGIVALIGGISSLPKQPVAESERAWKW